MTHGEGVWLFDDAGRRYLDLYAGHAVAALGYGDAGFAQTAQEMAQALIFQSNSVQLPARVDACAALSEFIPGGPWSTLLLNSGAEANENALRLAFRSTGRTVIAAVKGAFHGRTAAAAAVTDHSEGWYAFPHRPFEIRWLDPSCTDVVVGDDVAAVIVEPVQGVAGARDLPHDFLAEVQSAATAAGALVIADEVQSGMGRCGLPIASAPTPLRPDIVTLAKGIAAGFPAAALLAKPSLVVDLPVGSFGTTFGGGPVASRLISAMIERLREPEFLPRVQRIGARLRAESIGKVVRQTSGAGLLIGLHTSRPAKEIQAELLERGIIAGDAKDPNVVRLLPPLILEDAHVDQFLTTLKEIGN